MQLDLPDDYYGSFGEENLDELIRRMLKELHQLAKVQTQGLPDVTLPFGGWREDGMLVTCSSGQYSPATNTDTTKPCDFIMVKKDRGGYGLVLHSANEMRIKTDGSGILKGNTVYLGTNGCGTKTPATASGTIRQVVFKATENESGGYVKGYAYIQEPSYTD